MSNGAIAPRVGHQPLAAVSLDHTNPLERLPVVQPDMPGQGALQGCLVAVGDGLARKELLLDATESHGLGPTETGVADPGIFDASPKMLWEPAEVFHDAEALPPEPEDVFHDAEELGPELLRQKTDDQTAALGGEHLRLQTQPSADDNAQPLAETLVQTLPFELFVEESEKKLLSAQAGDAGNREDGEKVVEQQQGGLWSTLATFAGTVFKPVAIVADVIDHSQKMLEAGLYRIGGVAVNAATTAMQRALATEVPKTAREENTGRIRELIAQIDEVHQTLNAQIKSKTGENLISTEGRLTPVTTNSWSNVRNTAAGGASAVISALPGVSVGLAIPVVAGAVSPMFGVMGGLMLQASSYTTGAYVALSSLWRIPDDANQESVRLLTDAAMAKVKPLREELDSRLAEEKARQATDSRILLAGGARALQIDALRAQLKQVENVQQGIAPPDAKPQKPRSVALGDGVQRRQLLEESMGIRASFFLFFSRIIDAVFVRRKAANQEHAYMVSIRQSLDALATVGKHGNVSALEELAQERRKKALQGKMDPLALRRQLTQGENLAHTLLAAKAPSFGVAAFDGGELHGKRAIEASLTTSRLLALYLDTVAVSPQAPRPADMQAPHVVRNDDGSLTVSDPGRKLHSFLTGVPTAYSPGMLLQQGATASGAIVIDDHSPGMPGGTYGMQFEAGLDEEGTGDVLHIAFLPKRVGQVFAPLGNETAALFRLRDALRDGGAVAGPTPQELAQMPPAALSALHAQLDRQLAPLLLLEEADRAQQNTLENWRNPGSEADRSRIRG